MSALLRWYEAGADVQCNLPKLALYMGHVSIVSTAYYLQSMTAVILQASERFARSLLSGFTALCACSAPTYGCPLLGCSLLR